jgi:hypothetical protein
MKLFPRNNLIFLFGFNLSMSVIWSLFSQEHKIMHKTTSNTSRMRCLFRTSKYNDIAFKFFFKNMCAYLLSKLIQQFFAPKQRRHFSFSPRVFSALAGNSCCAKIIRKDMKEWALCSLLCGEASKGLLHVHVFLVYITLS